MATGETDKIKSEALVILKKEEKITFVQVNINHV